MSFHVVLYGKAGCCLCDECEILLASLRDEFVFTLQKVDIRDDEKLRERWKFQIPVVTIDGKNRLALRITVPRLRRAFQRAQAEKIRIEIAFETSVETARAEQNRSVSLDRN